MQMPGGTTSGLQSSRGRPLVVVVVPVVLVVIWKREGEEELVTVATNLVTVEEVEGTETEEEGSEGNDREETGGIWIEMTVKVLPYHFLQPRDQLSKSKALKKLLLRKLDQQQNRLKLQKR